MIINNVYIMRITYDVGAGIHYMYRYLINLNLKSGQLLCTNSSIYGI